MTTYFDRCRFFTPTTGAGATIAVGAAYDPSFLTPTQAGVVATDTPDYCIIDGQNMEVGRAVFGAGATSFTRTVTRSKIAGVAGTTPITLSGAAEVFLVDSARLLALAITDAPSDGNIYGRKDAGWVTVPLETFGATVHPYMFVTTAVSPPGSGSVRLNNANQTLATVMWLHYTNEDGIDTKNYFLERVQVGDHFYLQDRDDATKWQLYEISAAFTDNLTYATVPVTWKAGASPLTQQRIIISRETASSSGAATAVSDGPPGSPTAGQLWWESDSGKLLIWYDDGTSSQWVEVTSPGPPGQWVQVTQAEYDALSPPDPNTLYVVVG
jgi:hypothetical protein